MSSLQCGGRCSHSLGSEAAFLKNSFVHLFILTMLGLCCCFSPAAVSGAHSPVAVHGLLIAVASPVAEPWAVGTRASGLAAPRL